MPRTLPRRHLYMFLIRIGVRITVIIQLVIHQAICPQIGDYQVISAWVGIDGVGLGFCLSRMGAAPIMISDMSAFSQCSIRLQWNCHKAFTKNVCRV